MPFARGAAGPGAHVGALGIADIFLEFVEGGFVGWVCGVDGGGGFMGLGVEEGLLFHIALGHSCGRLRVLRRW